MNDFSEKSNHSHKTSHPQICKIRYLSKIELSDLTVTALNLNNSKLESWNY